MQIADVQAILKRIDVRLAELQMSKREFYEKSGISSGSFSQWNTGTHVPTTRKLSAAAKVLNVPLEYLLYGEGVLTQKNTAAPQGDGVSPAVSAHEKTPIGSESADRRSEEFAELFVKLNDAEKDIVLAQLRGLAQGR